METKPTNENRHRGKRNLCIFAICFLMGSSIGSCLLYFLYFSGRNYPTEISTHIQLSHATHYQSYSGDSSSPASDNSHWPISGEPEGIEGITLSYDDALKWLEKLGYEIAKNDRTSLATKNAPTNPTTRRSTIVPTTIRTTTTTEKPRVNTYFSHPARQFPKLMVDGMISTKEFLQACEAIGEFTTLLGRAFGMLRSDVMKNVEKVRKRFNQNQQYYRHIKVLIDKDLSENRGKVGDDSSTKGLLWLKRASEFVLELLRLFVEEYDRHHGRNVPEDLVPVLEKAYERTLGRHHGWFKRQAFKALKHAAPHRRDVMRAIGLGRTDINAVVIEDIKAYLKTFEENVKALNRLLIGVEYN